MGDSAGVLGRPRHNMATMDRAVRMCDLARDSCTIMASNRAFERALRSSLARVCAEYMAKHGQVTQAALRAVGAEAAQQVMAHLTQHHNTSVSPRPMLLEEPYTYSHTRRRIEAHLCEYLATHGVPEMNSMLQGDDDAFRVRE